MPQTRPEVNPKSFVPKKKLGAKTVGFVGASLAGGCTDLTWGGQGVCWDFFTGGGETGIDGENRRQRIVNYFDMLSRNIRGLQEMQ